MYCKLCTKYPSDQTNLIDLYSTEAKKLQILEIIQKHVSILEIDPNVHHTYTICSSCCRILCNFHELYLRVESALKGATIRETDTPVVLCEEFKLEDDIVQLEPNNTDYINAKSPQPAPENPNERRSVHLNAQTVHTQHEVPLQLESEIVAKAVILPSEAAVQALNIANDGFEQRMALDSAHYENEYFSIESVESMCKTGSRKSPSSVLEKYVQSLKFEVIENTDEFFNCSICNKVASDRLGLENHMQTHKERERIFQCDICSKRYFRRAVLMRHLQVHVPEEEKKAKCPKCEKSFPTPYIMKEHLKNIHLNSYSKMCETCGKSIKGRKAFRLHQQEHAGGQKVPKPSVDCEICGLKLTKYGLSRHMKIVHSEKNAECEICGLKFTKYGLSRHMESVHSEKKICTICSKVSPTVRSHREHMKYVHKLDRNHACPMCDKAFKTTKDLRVHIATHTGAALCKCSYCPKTYNSSSAMYSHRRKVHRKELEANATKM